MQIMMGINTKVYLLLFFCYSCVAFSQYELKGVVTNSSNERLAFTEIYNKDTAEKFTANASGEFVIPIKKTGTYSFVFWKENYTYYTKTIQNLSSSIEISVVLTPLSVQLDEVLLIGGKEKVFAVKKLRDIEETAIYAGKKTEVIVVDNLIVNKSTNNARQVYSRAVGLTINDNTDGGLQLSIGSRGLDPNRTANFNTRQNGYDISADVLGYPESYYATPTEAVEEIQIIRGAASLQYGTQFGGMINFKVHQPSQKPIELTFRNTIGSYGLYTNFTSLGGTKGKFSYYTFFNYKQGDGFRPNSGFESQNYFVNLNYQFTESASLHFDYTHFNYLAQQAGGLTDLMFYQDFKQSNRERNWFKVNWNLYALRFKKRFSETANFSLQLFGLDASRESVGYRANRVSSIDPDQAARDLIIGNFVNWGAEARYLKTYELLDKQHTFVLGTKYYQSKNTAIQGPGTTGKDADFRLAIDQTPNYRFQSNFTFPNLNISLFGENIFRLNSKLSITPGFRFENIKTQADGVYNQFGIFGDQTNFVAENRVFERNFLLFGIGFSYKPTNFVETYANISQNYRSVTFNDIRVAQPNFIVDPNISDEKGFTSDIGVRGRIKEALSYDISTYLLYYDNKISFVSTNSLNRLNTNIGTAITYGVEALLDWNIHKTFFKNYPDFTWNVFVNTAITDSEYIKTRIGELNDVADTQKLVGNKVEFVPLLNTKTGVGVGYKKAMLSFQYTYVSSQFTDASNSTISKDDNTIGIKGEIPAYGVADVSTSYVFGKFKIESGINNLFNTAYFTRRATGYPGPGIIPSEPLTMYLTLQYKF